MALALRYAARSDLGLLRDGNEDSGYTGPRLLVVADGMGGHVAGEVASAVAATTLSELESSPDVGSDPLAELADAIDLANEHLRQLVAGDPALRGMGTTLTALLYDGVRLGLAHVGDSRGYLLRDGVLQQITRDHSFVQSLIDEGRISKAQAETHPQRSLITQALDGREDVEPDLSLREARLGDRYLLCSDGLSDVVREETMRDVLNDSPDRDAACEALIDLALRAGGPDNITCIVADLVDADENPLPASAPGGFLGAAASTTRASSPDLKSDGGRARRARSAAGRGQDRPPRRRPERRAWWPTVTLALLALGGLLTYGLYAYSQRHYYVGADSADNVAIYRGVPSSVMGVALSSVEEPQSLPLRSLPSFNQERVRGNLEAIDLADARRIVASLKEEATRCAGVATPPAASPTATPSRAPSSTSTARPPAGCEGVTP